MYQVWISLAPPELALAPPAVLTRRGGPEPTFASLLAGRRLEVWSAPRRPAIRAAEDQAILDLTLGKSESPAPAADDPRLRLDLGGGQVEVHIPYTATAQLFWAQPQSDVLLLANDPRLLFGAQQELDPRGVFALLEYGALVAPFSLWRGVHRIRPGTTVQIEAASLRRRESWDDPWHSRAQRAGADSRATPAGSAPSGPEGEEAGLPPAAWPGAVARRLDAGLAALVPDARPVILFSGGVDSGLLAARARALGWGETLLLHYSRGPQDPETAVARAVARALRLELEVLPEAPHAWQEALSAPARDCAQPVGDYSAVPTMRLALDARERGRRVALDGSGADGLYGRFEKLDRWRRLYAYPAGLRRLLALLATHPFAWARDGRLARRLAAARISRLMPYRLASMISEHGLRGIAYRMARADVAAVQREILDQLERVGTLPGAEQPGSALPARMLDLRHIVCDFTAQKDAQLLLGTSHDVAYPFLDPSLVRVALQRVAARGEPDVSKGELKELLAAHVPRELVYRAKSGFSPPIGRLLATPPLADQLLRLERETHPLSDWLVPGAIQRMAAAVRARRPLPHRTYNFLWTILFVTLWLEDWRTRAARWHLPGGAGTAP